MRYSSDRKFDWVAALSVAFGILVLIPSLAALAVAVAAVVAAFF